MPDWPIPRPAATVVVAREGPAAPQVLMLRRHSKAVFASHYVFPGGVLEDEDACNHARATGADAGHCNELLALDNALDYYCAAIREAFEESGVLFARHGDGRWAFSDGGVSQDEIDDCRCRLNDGTLGWPAFLDNYDLRPAYDALTYIAYWVTPRVRDKRFSTRFFLGVLPDGQVASHDQAELTDSAWMTAAGALAAGKRGDIKLMYPTYSTLKEISRCDSVEDIVRWAGERAATGTARLLPAFVEIDGQDAVVMPGDPRYPLDFDT